jgi:hypothetical protein
MTGDEGAVGRGLDLDGALYEAAKRWLMLLALRRLKRNTNSSR